MVAPARPPGWDKSRVSPQSASRVVLEISPVPTRQNDRQTTSPVSSSYQSLS